MSVKKLSRSEWSRQVEREVRKRELQAELERSINKKLRWKRVKTVFPIPFAIGLLACFFVAYFYSLRDLGEMLLSWIIGMTFVSFILTWFGFNQKL